MIDYPFGLRIIEAYLTASIAKTVNKSNISRLFYFFSAKNDQEELFDAILEKDVEFPAEYWDSVSEDAKVTHINREVVSLDWHLDTMYIHTIPI